MTVFYIGSYKEKYKWPNALKCKFPSSTVFVSVLFSLDSGDLRVPEGNTLCLMSYTKMCNGWCVPTKAPLFMREEMKHILKIYKQGWGETAKASPEKMTFALGRVGSLQSAKAS